MERATPTVYTSISCNGRHVYHMEFDKYRPGFMIFTCNCALMTSNGTTSYIIAGSVTEKGYKEGVGTSARFENIYEFTQISKKNVVVVDYHNHCLRLIDRSSNSTTVFAGQCTYGGHKDGRQGQFERPEALLVDKRNESQLIIAGYGYKTLRTLDIQTRVMGTFTKMSYSMNHLTQDWKGDLYTTNRYAVFKITYDTKILTLISGSPDTRGYNDASLLDSMFGYPRELLFIGRDTLLVVDGDNSQLRLIDLKEDRVTTLISTSGHLQSPDSLLIANAREFYVGAAYNILKFECKYC